MIDMKYEGFYTDAALPVKPGTKVRVKKGTMLKSMHPSKDGRYPLGKTMTVTVHHVLNGVSMPSIDMIRDRRRYGDDDPMFAHVDWNEVDRLKEENSLEYYEQMIPMQNPTVVWAGAGGYWVSADINDVEICDA